jgi:molybdopterin-guanine dinucleotide biosynthesis protein A
MRITGVILAGGRGQRMGGVDKGLQRFNGKPLAQWTLERLHPQVDTLLVSANRTLEAYRAFGFAVVTDATPDFAGPLAGVQAALSAMKTPLLLTTPCDSPYLPDDLAARLLQGLQAAQADLAVAQTPDGMQRAFCLMRGTVLPSLTAYLQSGGRKVGDWQEQQKFCSVSFTDQADAFRNINTLAELSALQARQPTTNRD